MNIISAVRKETTANQTFYTSCNIPRRLSTVDILLQSLPHSLRSKPACYISNRLTSQHAAQNTGNCVETWLPEPDLGCFCLPFEGWARVCVCIWVCCERVRCHIWVGEKLQQHTNYKPVHPSSTQPKHTSPISIPADLSSSLQHIHYYFIIRNTNCSKAWWALRWGMSADVFSTIMTGQLRRKQLSHALTCVFFPDCH